MQVKVFDVSEPQLYIKTNLELYKTDYSDEQNKVKTQGYLHSSGKRH